MFRLQVLLLVSLLLAGALAAPHVQKKRSVKIERIRMKNYVPNGTKALKKVYAKYGMARTRDENDIVHKRFGKRFGDGALQFLPKEDQPQVNTAANSRAANGTTNDTGSVTASPAQNDAEFLSPVNIGGQQIVMDFDSGSSDMWVFNTALPANAQVNHQNYDPARSTTAATAEGNFLISYGDGSFANGPVGRDTVDIGGATVEGQIIGLPNNVSQSFIEDTVSNGLVGLAFDQLNTVRPTPAKTFFSNLAPNLTQQVYTANFKNGEVGSYEFGNIDRSQFTGDLVQVPVDASNGFWQFNSKQFSVGNGPVQANTQSGTAIADTGTSLMIVDASVVNGYYSQVPSAIDSAQVGGVVFACQDPLPDLQVAIGDNNMATVSGSLMNFARIGATNQQGQDLCFGGLQSNGGARLQIYGDVFFKAMFVSFQLTDPPTLGMAPHA